MQYFLVWFTKIPNTLRWNFNSNLGKHNLIKCEVRGYCKQSDIYPLFAIWYHAQYSLSCWDCFTRLQSQFSMAETQLKANISSIWRWPAVTYASLFAIQLFQSLYLMFRWKRFRNWIQTPRGRVLVVCATCFWPAWCGSFLMRTDSLVFTKTGIKPMLWLMS